MVQNCHPRTPDRIKTTTTSDRAGAMHGQGIRDCPGAPRATPRHYTEKYGKAENGKQQPLTEPQHTQTKNIYLKTTNREIKLILKYDVTCGRRLAIHATAMLPKLCPKNAAFDSPCFFMMPSTLSTSCFSDGGRWPRKRCRLIVIDGDSTRIEVYKGTEKGR